MKRILTRLVVIYICLTLFGCSRATPEQPSEITPEQDIQITQNTENTGDIKIVDNTTADGMYLGESLFFDESGSILYIDYKTKQLVVLCNNPSCSHNDESCTSYVQNSSAWSRTIAVSDQLLLIEQATSDCAAQITTMALNGFDKHLLASFANGETIMPDAFCADETYLYFVLEQVDEKSTSTKYCLTRMNLQTGVYEILFSQDGLLTMNLQGVQNNQLLLWVLQESKGSYQEQYLVFDIPNMQLLESKTADLSENGYGRVSLGNSFALIDYNEHELQVFHPITGTQENFSYQKIYDALQPNENQRIGIAAVPGLTDYFLVVLTTYDSTETSAYLWNTAEQTYTPFTLSADKPYDYIFPLAWTNDYAVVNTGHTSFTKTTESGTSFQLYVPQYALIAKEDYLQGNANYLFVESTVYDEMLLR